MSSCACRIEGLTQDASGGEALGEASTVAVVFFSYSHADEALRDRLEVALAMLKNDGVIETWHDRGIAAGDVLDDAIDAQMERADVILLLVSPDFLASPYCYGIEVQRAMELHEEGKARVIPVILRPCQWHNAPFGKLLAVPTDGKPVTKHADRDDAFLDISNAIEKVVRTASPSAAPRGRVAPSPPARARDQYAAASTAARSSNLRLKKTFTQADEDHFLDEAFQYMARFFEGSLEELQRPNPGVQTRFKRVDANTFTAVAYRNGEPIARCRIALGGMLGNGIAYSNNDTSPFTSFNENLSVVHDDQGLGLRPLGFGSFGRERNGSMLSMEGAAEAYWARFIEPLQR